MAYYQNNWATQNAVMQSKFHNAWDKLSRISSYWSNISTYWRRGALNEMNHEMENLWNEFYADCSKAERRFFRRVSVMVRDEFASVKIAPDMKDKMKHMNKAARLVNVKRNFLTLVEKGQGLGKKYQEEDEDLF